MRQLIYFILILGSCNSIGCQNNQVTEVEKTFLDTYLLLGQSNMRGWGNPDDIALSSLNIVASKADSYYYQGNFNQEFGAYKLERRDVEFPIIRNILDDFGIEGDSTVGIAFPFILNLLEKKSNKFLVLEHSHGNTSLYGAWNPNWTIELAQAVGESNESRHKLYRKLLNKIATADSLAIQLGYKGIDIKAICFLQGENDCKFSKAALSYEENMNQFIDSLRNNINKPDIPFILFQVNPMHQAYVNEVRTAQLNVGAINHNYTIPSSSDTTYQDYSKQVDKLHYKYLGLKGIADKFTALINN